MGKRVIINPLFLSITDDTVERDVKPMCTDEFTSSEIGDDLVMVYDNKVQRVKPITHKEKRYLAPFPNPILLFLNLSLEHFELSERIKEEKFAKCGRDRGRGLFMLYPDDSGTHQCYNEYLSYRISSIVNLVTSLEAFLNYIIPDDYVYNSPRTGKPMNKKDIQSSSISFMEKFKKVVPLCIGDADFWIGFEKEQEAIEQLYNHRKNIIHLKIKEKTNGLDVLDDYFYEFSNMLDFDLQQGIESAIHYMNRVKPNFAILIDKNHG